MKLLFDFFPLLLFFAAFKLYDIYVATGVAIAASVLQVGYQWMRHRRLENMHLITLGVVVVFGGLTLYLQDERFIKWKPTIVNWSFAAVFLVSQFAGAKTVVERMMSHAVELPQMVWRRLNLMWTAFFIAMGLANLYVMSEFDTDTWAKFKVFGMMGLTVAFILAQSFYLARHIKQEEPSEGHHG